MKAISLLNAIKKRGGQAEIKAEAKTKYDGSKYTSYSLVAELNGYDIEMVGMGSDPDDLGSSFWTARRVSGRGHYDPGSDYNPGNWEFNNRINDLDRYNG